MIPEYRQRAFTRRSGLRWPIRLRLLLIVPGSHKWNRWVRDATARMEGHASYNAETTEPALRVARDALRDDGRLVVESLDPNCFMLLIEDEAGAEVVMRDDDGPKRYLGDVRVYRNGEGEPMVSIADEGGAETRVFLAAVERIVIL